MSTVLFSVWYSIQGFIQNTTCSVWFRIQRIIKKCPGYYSASGSLFRVLFKMRLAASGSGFSVLLKMSRVLFSVWFSSQGIIQNTTCSVWFRIQRIIKKCPGYYSASGSVFRVLFKIRPASSDSGFSVLKYSGYYSAYGSVFSVLLKNVKGIIQSRVHDSAYYKKMSRVLFSVWFSSAQVAWKPRECRHQACTGSIALKQRGSSRSPKSPPIIGWTECARSQHRSRSGEAPRVSPA